jgi:hypothetical protein
VAERNRAYKTQNREPMQCYLVTPSLRAVILKQLHTLLLQSSIQQQLLQVIMELRRSIILRDLNLEQLVFGHESGQLGQTLTSTTSDTEQQRVATGLAQDTANA